MARHRRNPSKKTWFLITGAGVGLLAVIYLMSDAKAAPSAESGAALANWRADSMDGQVARPLLTRADGSMIRVSKGFADSLVAAGKAYWESAYHGSLREGTSPFITTAPGMAETGKARKFGTK